MANKVKLNNSAFKQLRKSPEVQKMLRDKATAISDAARSSDIEVVKGEHGHYGVDSVMGKSRARARVYTANTAARLDQAVHSTLTKAIDAGKG